MATVFYYGLQTTRRARVTLTVGYAASQTWTLTVNGKAVAFTATANETTAAQVASAIALLAGATAESNFSECAFSSSGASLFVDGPEDGGPITASGSATGGATFATASTVTGVSKHDLNDTANYSGAALPLDNDTLVFPKGCPAAKYNLDALDTISINVLREFGGGKLGLPDFRANGQAEWRPTRVQLFEPLTVRLNVDETDAQSIRIQSLGDMTICYITGAAQSTVGQEVVELIGVTNPIYVNGCSLATGTQNGVTDTAIIYATNSTLRIGTNAVSQGITVIGGIANVSCSWTNDFVVDGNAQVAVMGSASGRPIVESGTMVWLSSGDCVAPVIGSDGFLDFDGGTGAVAISGANQSVILSSGAAATGGTASFRVPSPNGSYTTTASVTWNATDATLIANVQAAINTLTGTTNEIVVSGATPDTSLTFTFSGANYRGKEWPTIQAVTWFTSWSGVSSTSGVGTARPYQITRKADNARLRDTTKRITRPFTLVNDRCTMDGENVQLGNHNNHVVTNAA